MTVYSQIPSVTDSEGFRAAQRLAFACANAIHADLRPGVTEREVAAAIKTWLTNHGVSDHLHQPFVWFGPRTALRGLAGLKSLRGFNPAFFPSNKKLTVGMPFILDCAPVLDGYPADIGYTGVLGENKILDQLMDDLAAHRELIITLIREHRLMAEVSQAVDALCARQGVEPRHHAYPFSVLAHRVEKLPDSQLRPKISIAGFGIRSVLSLGRAVIRGLREDWSPLWNSRHHAAHPPTPGLWAVAPHLGFHDVGAKFEELLVITEDDACWLDDDVPHVKRWLERSIIGEPTNARLTATATTAIKAPEPTLAVKAAPIATPEPAAKPKLAVKPKKKMEKKTEKIAKPTPRKKAASKTITTQIIEAAATIEKPTDSITTGNITTDNADNRLDKKTATPSLDVSLEIKPRTNAETATVSSTSPQKSARNKKTETP